MILNTLIFFLITFTSFVSFIGYGKLTNHLLFNTNQNQKNQFNFFFLGLIVIIPVSYIYNISINNNYYFNYLFFLIGIFFYFFIPGSKDYRSLFLLTLIFFLGLLISKTHEDFTSYHFQHLREISENYLIFGLANLDERYFYSSIFSYVQVLFKFHKFDLDLIHIPVYLIYLSLIGYLWSEIQKENKSFLLSIVFFLIIVKFRRISEFGYDYIGQFILIYVFFEYLFKSEISKEKNTKLALVYFTTLLIKISNLYFLPIIMTFLLFQKTFLKLFDYKKIIIVVIPFFFVFSFNSYLKTGCINYILKDTCISSKIIDWKFDYKKIENSKKIIKNWSKGLYHQKKIKLTEEEYNKNFNWVKNWFDVYALNKIGKFLLIFIIITLILKFLVFNKKFSRNFDTKLYLGAVLSLLIWFLNFPQFRFGFSIIIIFLILSVHTFVGESKIYKKNNFLILLILSLVFFNIDNVNRIYREFKRDDVYKFTNFPWYAKPILNYKYENSDNFKFVRSAKNKSFWTTCFNAPITCANHNEELKFRLNGRNLFVIDFEK